MLGFVLEVYMAQIAFGGLWIRGGRQAAVMCHPANRERRYLKVIILAQNHTEQTEAEMMDNFISP